MEISPISPQPPLTGVRKVERDKRQNDNAPKQQKQPPKRTDNGADDDQSKQHIDEIV